MKKFKLKWTSVIRLLLLVVCGSVLGVNIYLANANQLVGNRLPMPFGCGAAVVLSGSMEPALRVDDLIVVRAAHDYQVGEIVVYQDGSSLVVHRIIEIDGEQVITKGDANDIADAAISLSDVKGRVVGRIPLVGKLVSLLKTPFGIVAVLAAAIALIEIPRRREKKKDDEARQQILEEIYRLRTDAATAEAEATAEVEGQEGAAPAEQDAAAADKSRPR